MDAAHVAVEWNDADPVGVFVSADPGTGPDKAEVVSKADRSGRVVVPSAVTERRYFILRDGGDQSVVRVAERVLPLEQGSNFRDVGGYAGAGGKHVAWGNIAYHSSHEQRYGVWLKRILTRAKAFSGIYASRREIA